MKNTNVSTMKDVNTDIERLRTKMNKRIGMTATTTDNCKTGMITGFTFNTDGNLTVNYLIAFGEGKNAILRLVNEMHVSILKAPNK